MDSSSFTVCSKCIEDTIQKPKIGIHPCHGCQLSFCLTHLTKHRSELLDKLDSVIIQRDEIFESTFNNINITNENVEKSLENIGEWETKMHECLHQFAEHNRDNVRLEFTRQLNEIKLRYDEFTKDLTNIRDTDHFFEHDIENLSRTLEQFKREIQQIAIDLQLPSMESIGPCQLPDINQPQNTIISYLNHSQLVFDRKVLSLHERNCFFLAASNTHILAYILSINRNENRLVLYNIFNGSELCFHELDLQYGNVCDIIYSEKLNGCFLVACRQTILIYDPQRMMLKTISEMKPIDEHPFWSITISTNTNDAFVSLDSNGYIERWSTETHPHWTLIKRWNTKDIMQDVDHGIRMVRICADKSQLFIIVLQQDKTWRIDSFDINLQLISRGPNLNMSCGIDKPGFGCRLVGLLDDNAWLLTERATSLLWYINGSTLKKIDKNVHSACLIMNNDSQRRIAMIKNESMKRSHSSTDSEAIKNDDKLYQEPDAKMVESSSTRLESNSDDKVDHSEKTTTADTCVEHKPAGMSSSNSLVLGSFSEPPTYVIHILDSHLTFLQSFQICSLFGRVRIHGYNLSPLKFYSMYNYGTNSPLSIELIDSSTTMSSSDAKSLILDVELADKSILNVQQNGGDIILIRKESTNDSQFIKTMREHESYRNFFCEDNNSFTIDKWKQLEQDLSIRFIKTTDQSTVIAPVEFISVVDHIINRWLNEATDDIPFLVFVCGEKDMGKSTFIRYLINRSLNHMNSTFGLTYFDCDTGQCEFTIGGCLSYTDIDSPLLGPPCSHIRSNPKPDRILYYGHVSPQAAPVRYLEYVNRLRELWNIDHTNGNQKRSMIVINTMGWGTGLGLELQKEIICMCYPNIVIQLDDNSVASQGRAKMPDLTLEWLMQQHVYTPYRNKTKMKHNGRLNYEYIKIKSAAATSTSINSIRNKPKLHPRDHRHLASWSYFFSSSNLKVIHLPWSQLIHVSLLNKTHKNSATIPNSLEHSMVALCSSEQIDRLKHLSVTINGTFQLLNYQDEIFECLGFGWIEQCNRETKSYTVYTPADDLSYVNLFVYGAFDTSDKFQHMFNRVNLK